MDNVLLHKIGAALFHFGGVAIVAGVVCFVVGFILWVETWPG